MRVLIIGRWGKTHALAKAMAQSKDVELYSFMDKKNNGIADISSHYELGDITDVSEVERLVKEHDIEFVLVVPEMTLNQGVTDRLNEMGIPCVGPSEFCTKLEGDKGFLRSLMRNNGIDASPDYHIFNEKNEAIAFIKTCEYPVAVKPAGITEGDGVKVEGIQLKNKEEAVDYVREIFKGAIGGLPSVIIEEKIEGEEYTLQVLCDGKNMVPLPAVRDYKLLNEGESGLNTPGMGSYSCADHLLPFLGRDDFDKSMEILGQILDVLKDKYDEEFQGFLSGQFMLTKDGIKLIEINVRPGDSEILNITPILETDFLEVCKAMAEQRLDTLEVSCLNKATVCKYAVPEGFPTPEGTVKITIDQDVIDDPDIHLFQSCFEAGENEYQPSPRLFAITGVGDDLGEAYAKCEQGLKAIKGKGIFHRKDVGTRELTDKYKQYDFLKPVSEEEEPQLP